MEATHDTIRWGDRTSINWTAATVAAAPNTSPTKQLVQAHWHWPLTWQLNVILVPQFAADEVATFRLGLRVQLGSGSGLTSFRLFYILAPTPGSFTWSGGYDDIFDDTKFFAARDVQITIDSLTLGTDSGITASEDTLEVGAYVAPVTEPHATLGTMDEMQRQNPQYQAPQMERWMGEGGGMQFHEQALYYDPQRRR